MNQIPMYERNDVTPAKTDPVAVIMSKISTFLN